MEFLIILLAVVQVVSFIYLKKQIKKVKDRDPKETLLIKDDFDKIKQTSNFSQNLFHRLYGEK